MTNKQLTDLPKWTEVCLNILQKIPLGVQRRIEDYLNQRGLRGDLIFKDNGTDVFEDCESSFDGHKRLLVTLEQLRIIKFVPPVQTKRTFDTKKDKVYGTQEMIICLYYCYIESILSAEWKTEDIKRINQYFRYAIDWKVP